MLNDNNEWEILSEDIDIDRNKVLGSGEFGRVFLGCWRGIRVAVKEFFETDDHKTRLMMNEFHVMTRLHHPNIIQLLGYTRSPFRIVMEYMPNGSVQDFFSRHRLVSLKTRVNMALDIARGLCYLHQRRPSYVIHRDLKPSNFLMDHDRVKISDFGISKILMDSETSRSQDGLCDIEGTANVGTMCYMAPELMFKKSARYSASVDIYSYGAFLYEVFERKKMYTDKDDLLEQMKQKTVPRFHHTPGVLRGLIRRCLDHRPEQRPTPHEIIRDLTSIPVWCLWLYWS
jgi:serine/threonine protein kinase